MNATTGILRTQVAPKAGPQVDALYVEGKNPATQNSLGAVKRKVDGDTTEYFVPTVGAQAKSAAYQITAEQNGSTFYVTGGTVISLPDAVPGMEYTVIFGDANNANAISPKAADGIAAKGLTAVVDKDLVNSTGAAYDSAVLRCVAVNLWHAVVTGTFTKQA